MLVCLLQRTIFFTLTVVGTVGVPYKLRFPEYEELISCGNGTNNCCVGGDKCGTNLLCTQGGGIGRQYCAVKDWTGCSSLAPEIDYSGLGLEDCGGNIVCYNSTTCCTDGTALSYVNPLTGEVKDAKSKDGDATLSPTYWKVDSVGILASMRTASSSQTVTSSEAITSSSVQTTSSDSRATPTSTPTSTSASTANESNQSSGGISAGTGAGIGIGATAAVAFIALLAWLFLRERKKRRALQAQSQAQEPVMDMPMQQPQGAWKDANTEYYAHESPNSHLELDEDQTRHEMDHGRTRQELP